MDCFFFLPFLVPFIAYVNTLLWMRLKLCTNFEFTLNSIELETFHNLFLGDLYAQFTAFFLRFLLWNFIDFHLVRKTLFTGTRTTWFSSFYAIYIFTHFFSPFSYQWDFLFCCIMNTFWFLICLISEFRHDADESRWDWKSLKHKSSLQIIGDDEKKNSHTHPYTWSNAMAKHFY